jgi:hypothetical protein
MARLHHGDNLLSRLLISHPISESIEIIDLTNTKTIPSLQEALLFNELLHYHQRIYGFDKLAHQALDLAFQLFRGYSIRMNNFDVFLRY